jgi:DNA-binding response OmpR family regulator
MASDSRSWHGGRLLVVEDNYLLADVICDFLRECRLEPVGPAANIDRAERLAREQVLDGAVLDVNLANRLCFPVCSILGRRQIPFLFLTGYRNLSVIPDELRQVPLICKPFDTNELTMALSEVLGRSIASSRRLLPN